MTQQNDKIMKNKLMIKLRKTNYNSNLNDFYHERDVNGWGEKLKYNKRIIKIKNTIKNVNLYSLF